MSILTQLSPGIAISEIDLTGIVPAVSTSVGAHVGQFNWGPCDIPTLIQDENELAVQFGVPTGSSLNSFAASTFFACASFLAYTNALYVVRSVDSNTAKNAIANTNANATTILIKNETAFENTYLYTNSSNAYGSFVAKYPGAAGNSLKVSVCASASQFDSWTYKSFFDNAPGTSSYVSEKYSNPKANDELHVVVLDAYGAFSGKANTVLEKFPYLSKALDAIDINGRKSYYKDHILNNSQYIYAIDPPDYSNSVNLWGQVANSTIIYNSPSNLTVTLNKGVDGNTVSSGDLNNNWALFKDKDQYEISLAFMGDAPIATSQYVLDNVVLGSESETPTVGRKDTIMFVSPRYSDVVNQPGQEVSNVITGVSSWLKTLSRASSYMVADSGWKYMYDRYNNIYRWIPLNADIAGLCAYTDSVADPWYSPGGYNRGKLKNVVKLAWSPALTDRDVLYSNGINPIISQRGEGIIMLGDKTMQAKPSAFDRINVRRLFITLEKAISRAARYTLFEFNDPFTRAQFVAMVEPYLRTVKGRRGIVDYKVVCDESNNTADIINRNAFVGDIYIKPNYSINFIQLNFVAVKNGVEFNTVIGQQ